MWLVSACLLGVRCRFDGGAEPDETVVRLAASGGVVPVCPEQLGGLTTPRLRSEFREGDGRAVLDGRARVVAEDGSDVTEAFERGAYETLAIARRCDATRAVLKERSPSCGLTQVYIDGRLADGLGVTAALLVREGIEVASSEDMGL